MKSIEEIKTAIIPLMERHSITRCAIFGSYARGDETERSDIDLLFSIEKHMTLEEWDAMEKEFETTLEKHVDFIEFGTFSKRVEAEVMKEAIMLYEKP